MTFIPKIIIKRIPSTFQRKVINNTKKIRKLSKIVRRYSKIKIGKMNKMKSKKLKIITILRKGKKKAEKKYQFKEVIKKKSLAQKIVQNE